MVYDTFQTKSHEGNKDDDRIQAQQNDNHELQENIEKEIVELHHFEHEYVFLQNTSLEITNSELFDCQKDIPHIQKVVVASKVFQKSTKFFPSMNDKEDKHMIFIPLENGIGFNEMEQWPIVKSEGKFTLFVDQGEVIVHGFDDPFVSLLESSIEMDLMVFINHGDLCFFN